MSSSLSQGSKSMFELETLKFLAIILITNSHLSNLYPNPNMGTGGSLGNTLFFLVSAIGLTLSLSKKKAEFFNWFAKRFSRSFPITWVATVLMIFAGIFTLDFTVPDLFATFIFPSKYWFIPAITFFYIPIYFVINNYSIKEFTYVTIFITLLYFGIYLTFLDINIWTIEGAHLFKWIFYFQVMVFGVFVAKNYQKFNYTGISDFIVLILLTIFYFGFKFAMTKFNDQLMPFQFILHLVTIPWAGYLLKVCRSQSVNNALNSSKYIKSFVALISGITLEIYLLQIFFYKLPIVQSQIFPINILLFAVLLVPAAWVLNRAYYFNYSGLLFKQKTT